MPRKATVKQRAMAWMVGRDSGLSSEAIWAHMTGAGKPGYGWSHPHDPSDLGRCLRLLKLIPEWRKRLPEMAKRSKHWSALIRHWEMIEASMIDEVGIDWSKGQRAAKTYDLMKSIGL